MIPVKTAFKSLKTLLIGLFMGLAFVAISSIVALSDTPLHAAAGRGGHFTVLLDAGTDLNAQSEDGTTPLDEISEDSPAYKSPAGWRLHGAKFK